MSAAARVLNFGVVRHPFSIRFSTPQTVPIWLIYRIFALGGAEVPNKTGKATKDNGLKIWSDFVLFSTLLDF